MRKCKRFRISIFLRKGALQPRQASVHFRISGAKIGLISQGASPLSHFAFLVRKFHSFRRANASWNPLPPKDALCSISHSQCEKYLNFAHDANHLPGTIKGAGTFHFSNLASEQDFSLLAKPKTNRHRPSLRPSSAVVSAAGSPWRINRRSWRGAKSLSLSLKFLCLQL